MSIMALRKPIFNNFQQNFCLRVPPDPEAPFYWKLFKIGMPSAKDIKKMYSFFKFEGAHPCPAHTACIQGSFIAYRAKWSKTSWMQCM